MSHSEMPTANIGYTLYAARLRRSCSGGVLDLRVRLTRGKEKIILGTSATAATARYHKKKGLISKSYKLDREVVEAFAEACENAETSQAKELTKFMKRYIRKHHPDYE